MKTDQLSKTIAWAMVILWILFTVYVCSSCKEQDPEPSNIDITGSWDAILLPPGIGAAMEQTRIDIYQTTYLFYSNTIMGELIQQGSYSVSADSVLTIELSLNPNPFNLIGKAGSKHKLQLIGATRMYWTNLDNGDLIKWQK